MQTDQIQRYVKGTGTKVCASDELPRHRIKSGIYISNTDVLNKRGTHWVLLAVLNTPERRVYFFDTLSVPPLIEYFYKFLKCNVDGAVLELNRNVIQSSTSENCGKYCTALAWHLFRGGTFEQFCKIYSSKPEINDEKIVGDWPGLVASYKNERAGKKR